MQSCGRSRLVPWRPQSSHHQNYQKDVTAGRSQETVGLSAHSSTGDLPCLDVSYGLSESVSLRFLEP